MNQMRYLKEFMLKCKVLHSTVQYSGIQRDGTDPLLNLSGSLIQSRKVYGLVTLSLPLCWAYIVYHFLHPTLAVKCIYLVCLGNFNNVQLAIFLHALML